MEIDVVNYPEHYDGSFEHDFPDTDENQFQAFFQQKKNKLVCFELVRKRKNELHLKTNYAIGLDWIIENEYPIGVYPKYNSESDEEKNVPDVEIDVFKMLFEAFKHQDVASHVGHLVEIHWEKPRIQVSRKNDLLTPFLVIEFLLSLKAIVRKGLQKSYYRVEHNLQSRVKGKVLVAKNLKQNVFKNHPLNTYCSYDHFGIDIPENRILKKALQFTKWYLANYNSLADGLQLRDLYSYIRPAFDEVEDNISLHEIKHLRRSAFFKEYDRAIELAQMILKNFGYNQSNTEMEKIELPPFWIDMPLLFELYVLGKLKDEYGGDVDYHPSTYGNELDFLLTRKDEEMVIDAKYKRTYLNGKQHDDIRQVSGYSRLSKVYELIEIAYPKSINCLIIYPDLSSNFDNLADIMNQRELIEGYEGMYKLGIKIPVKSAP